jgi:DTW domain-containing protein YfiP
MSLTGGGARSFGSRGVGVAAVACRECGVLEKGCVCAGRGEGIGVRVCETMMSFV